MTNMNLNAGGVIGALLAVGLAVAYVFLENMHLPARSGKLIGFIALGGGVFGNWLWSLVFAKREVAEEDVFRPHGDE